MKVLISGSTGLIGSALLEFLRSHGQEAIALTRSEPRPGELAVRWDPQAGTIDQAALEGLDAVVHLAGESIAGEKWNARKMARIRDSRVKGTALLSEALAGLKKPPSVLVSASAVGFYGDRGDEILREDSPPGRGFLAEVCQQWEASAEPARRRGIRVVHPRFTTILSHAGGVLPKMVAAFSIGAGGRIGAGRQWWSWIAIDDAIAAIHHLLASATLAGPVNIASPAPVTNADFTRTLAHVLSRPAMLPLPAFAARLAFGKMAEEVMLASARVEPAQLISDGFLFRYPQLEPALRKLLGK